MKPYLIFLGLFISAFCKADSTTVRICYNGEIGFPFYKTVDKEINHFDSNGKLIVNENYEFEYYPWEQHDTNFRFNNRTDYGYNVAGLIDSVLETKIDVNGIYYYRTNYFYDPNGNLIEKDRFFGYTFPLDSNLRTTYLYDANNNRIQEKNEQYANFNQYFWTENLLKWTYDLQDRLIEYRKINYLSNSPHDSLIEAYTYSVTDKILTKEEWRYATFADSNYYEYAYDVNDSLVSYTINNNVVGNLWVPYLFYTYTYSSSTVNMMVSNCPDTTCSDTMWREITVYDASGKITNYNREDYDGSGYWETIRFYINTYDSTGKIIDFQEHQGGGGHSYNEHTTYDYNSVNDLIHTYTLIQSANQYYSDCYYYSVSDDSMIVILDFSDTICSNSLIPLAITVEGGVPPYQYDWSPGNFLSDSTILSPLLTNLDSTITYNLTVTDFNGLSASDTIAFSALPYLYTPVSITTIGYPCENNLFQLTYDPIPNNYSPHWSSPVGYTLYGDTINATTSGQYTLYLTDINNCSYSYPTTINLFPQPLVSLGPDTTICIDDTLTLNGGNFSQYQWSTGDTASFIDLYFSAQNSDTISLRVTDNNGCYNSDTTIVNAVICLRIADADYSGISVTIYPEKLYVEFEYPIRAVELILSDLSGKIVLKKLIQNSQYIDISQLEQGVYVYSFDKYISGKLFKR